MGDALRKQDAESSPDVVDAKTSMLTSEATEAVLEVSPVPSPAKALQTKLDQHFAARQSKFTGRFITWLVIGTCAGTWLTGVGLYATL